MPTICTDARVFGCRARLHPERDREPFACFSVRRGRESQLGAVIGRPASLSGAPEASHHRALRKRWRKHAKHPPIVRTERLVGGEAGCRSRTRSGRRVLLSSRGRSRGVYAAKVRATTKAGTSFSHPFRRSAPWSGAVSHPDEFSRRRPTTASGCPSSARSPSPTTPRSPRARDVG